MFDYFILFFYFSEFTDMRNNIFKKCAKNVRVRGTPVVRGVNH